MKNTKLLKLIFVLCKFRGEGTTMLRITESYTYRAILSLFIVIKCSTLQHPVNGRIISNSRYCGGEPTEFICYAGYRLEGSRTITCQSNRKWSAYSPVCVGKFSSADTKNSPTIKPLWNLASY
jgi:hypothetical protein